MEGIQCICVDTFAVIHVACQNCGWRREDLVPGRWACDAHGQIWDERSKVWVWPSDYTLKNYMVWCPECGYQAMVSF